MKSLSLEDNGVRATTRDLMLKGVSNVQVPSEIGSVYRVFYPVWFMSYRNGNNITYATVNGQTGKVVADFPISTSRFILAALLAALAPDILEHLPPKKKKPESAYCIALCCHL